jgi:5,10-methenyltetrahydrofolate synthetase
MGIMDNSDQAQEKKALRAALIAQRNQLPDRQVREDLLQRVMRIWLVGRPDIVIGAYWPIKGEFDPLPALHRWKEDGELIDQPEPRRIGLPVVNKETHTMTFHAWYPGCPMEEDAFGIPKPKDTEVIVPTLVFAPCVGYSAGGYRLGYGGGFYDRMLASLTPKPFSVGLGFGMGFLPDFEPEPHDMPLDAILNDYGVVWPV